MINYSLVFDCASSVMALGNSSKHFYSSALNCVWPLVGHPAIHTCITLVMCVVFVCLDLTYSFLFILKKSKLNFDTSGMFWLNMSRCPASKNRCCVFLPQFHLDSFVPSCQTGSYLRSRSSWWLVLESRGCSYASGAQDHVTVRSSAFLPS